jgi:hypothetical protein
LISDEAAHAEDTSNADGEESEPCLTEIEVIDRWVHKRENFEELSL